jgi:tRNA threonylcarbamoyladenosine biosynthesis protein TsaE
MGVTARVTSPTFVLVNEYAAEQGCRLVHIDAYRLAEGAALADAATFGLAELLADAGMDGVNVVAIEWADRIQALLPADRLEIEITAVEDDPDARTLHITATGEQSARLLTALFPANPVPRDE